MIQEFLRATSYPTMHWTKIPPEMQFLKFPLNEAAPKGVLYSDSFKDIIVDFSIWSILKDAKKSIVWTEYIFLPNSTAYCACVNITKLVHFLDTHTLWEINEASNVWIGSHFLGQQLLLYVIASIQTLLLDFKNWTLKTWVQTLKKINTYYFQSKKYFQCYDCQVYNQFS